MTNSIPPSREAIAVTPEAPEKASRLVGKRLLLVEEALKSHVGHWYEYDRAVCDIHRAVGIETTVAAHTEVGFDIRESLPAEPVFPYTNWDNIYAHSAPWRRYLGIAHHNLRVYQTMDRFLTAKGPFDCVFAPTVVIYHIIGWRALLARHLGRSFSRLVLLFRNNVGSYGPESQVPTFKRNSIVWRKTLRSFAQHIENGSVCLATDSDRLATEYEYLGGIRPVVFPSPRIALPAELSQGWASGSDVYTFGCLGPARFEKGIDLLQAAIARFLAAQPTAAVRFLVQWNQDIISADGSIYRPDPVLEADRRVIFLRDEIDSERYMRLIAEIDCMVLPYRREAYFARISGVAVEAVTAAIPVIYTKDTWTEDFVLGVGAGLGFRSGDIDSLAVAISTAVEQREQLAALAVARSHKARDDHSADRFLGLLWGKTNLSAPMMTKLI